MIDTWRSGVRSAMCAASQLPGRGPTDVDIIGRLQKSGGQKIDIISLLLNKFS